MEYGLDLGAAGTHVTGVTHEVLLRRPLGCAATAGPRGEVRE
jgi:hypothetical protein